jgi:hypothetical protein
MIERNEGIALFVIHSTIPKRMARGMEMKPSQMMRA